MKATQQLLRMMMSPICRLIQFAEGHACSPCMEIGILAYWSSKRCSHCHVPFLDVGTIPAIETGSELQKVVSCWCSKSLNSCFSQSLLMHVDCKFIHRRLIGPRNSLCGLLITLPESHQFKVVDSA